MKASVTCTALIVRQSNLILLFINDFSIMNVITTGKNTAITRHCLHFPHENLIQRSQF